MRNTKAVLVVLCVLAASPSRGEAAVLFENTGTLTGWSRVYAQEQGTNTLVSTPTFEGPSALKATQTFAVADGRGYHSERVMFDVQRNGQDQYYGLALYLPPDWVFHNQNVTFQQWGVENPGGGGPWILMFVQNDKIRMGGSGASGSRDIATITGLRGTWIRIVTRINMTASGPFDVWVNGTKSLSAPINLVVGGDPPTIRWANGIYCTAWRTQQPAGGSPLSVWHDHFRIATTYAEAEPANWGSPMQVDAAAADGPTMPDAAAPADGRASDSASAGADGSGSGSGGRGGAGGGGAGGGGAGGGGAGGTGAGGSSGGAGGGGAATGGTSGTGGRAGPTPGSGGTGGTGGDMEPPGGSQKASGCACAVGTRGPARGPALLVLPFAATLFARRRAKRARSPRRARTAP
jgi:hypothetical protein